MSTVLEKPVLLDETGQAIVNKLEDIKDMIGTTGEFIPVQIIVTTPPTKTTFFVGETLDLSGIVVKLEGSNGAMFDVTAQCTFSPDNGDVLTSSDTSVLISYHWYKDNIDFSTRQPIDVISITSISITTPPTKVNYFKGDQLDLSGIVVKGNTDISTQVDVTNLCTFSPADGSTLSTLGTIAVTATLTISGQTYTASTNIEVELKIVTWANGTDAEIADMLAAHYAGDIDISDYWSVGDERVLSDITIPGLWTEYSTMTFVILNFGGKILSSDGTTECAAIVGTKEASAGGVQMNTSATSSGGWGSSALRAKLNSDFKNGLPESFRALFKEHKNKSASSSASTYPSAQTVDDYFAQASEMEIFGTTTYANATIEANNSQFDYYKTAANRIKYAYGDNTPMKYWERSPYSGDSGVFCSVAKTGTPDASSATNRDSIAPFGCI